MSSVRLEEPLDQDEPSQAVERPDALVGPVLDPIQKQLTSMLKRVTVGNSSKNPYSLATLEKYIIMPAKDYYQILFVFRLQHPGPHDKSKVQHPMSLHIHLPTLLRTDVTKLKQLFVSLGASEESLEEGTFIIPSPATPISPQLDVLLAQRPLMLLQFAPKQRKSKHTGTVHTVQVATRVLGFQEVTILDGRKGFTTYRDEGAEDSSESEQKETDQNTALASPRYF